MKYHCRSCKFTHLTSDYYNLQKQPMIRFFWRLFTHMCIVILQTAQSGYALALQWPISKQTYKWANPTVTIYERMNLQLWNSQLIIAVARSTTLAL